MQLIAVGEQTGGLTQALTGACNLVKSRLDTRYTSGPWSAGTCLDDLAGNLCWMDRVSNLHAHVQDVRRIGLLSDDNTYSVAMAIEVLPEFIAVRFRLSKCCSP